MYLKWESILQPNYLIISSENILVTQRFPVTNRASNKLKDHSIEAKHVIKS